MHAGRGNFAIHSAPNDLNAITGVDAALVLLHGREGGEGVH